MVKARIFKHFCKNYPNLAAHVEEAYEDMIEAFELSQLCLSSPRFCVPFDAKGEIQEGQAQDKSVVEGGLTWIPYFSDFILMQQLRTLELDIILGQTNNKIKGPKELQEEYE